MSFYKSAKHVKSLLFNMVKSNDTPQLFTMKQAAGTATSNPKFGCQPATKVNVHNSPTFKSVIRNTVFTLATHCRRVHQKNLCSHFKSKPLVSS